MKMYLYKHSSILGYSSTNRLYTEVFCFKADAFIFYPENRVGSQQNE